MANDLLVGILVVLARAYNGSAPECVVINTKTFAVTEYLGVDFNSYTRFNGVDLAANQNGIYAFDTTDLDDEAFKIKAHIKTGQVDIYNGTIQRLRNGYLTQESDGDLRVVTVANGSITRKYMLTKPQDSEGLIERRVKFERGIKERVFDFKVENVDGSSITIDSLLIMLEPIISKKG